MKSCSLRNREEWAWPYVLEPWTRKIIIPIRSAYGRLSVVLDVKFQNVVEH
jgi:hypothetical protein